MTSTSLLRARAATDIAPAPVDTGRFAWTLALICVAITVPRLLLHEMWRDEAWQWLALRESDTLAELFAEHSRTGRGYLFSLLCWPLARLTSAAQAMQLLNLLLCGACVYVFARWAPLRRLECVLVVLGYHFSYEFAIVSPHYGLGVLLTALACLAATRQAPVALGLALGLLCQTTVYGFIIALAIAAGFLLQRWHGRALLQPLVPTRLALGVILFAAGAIAGLAQLMPEPDSTFVSGWRVTWDAAWLERTLQVPWRAFVPLPASMARFWDTDLLMHWPLARAIASVALLALAGAWLWPSRIATAVFALGAAALLLFTYTKLFGMMRHHAQLWLLFIAALWLAGGFARSSQPRSWRERSFVALLLAQVAAAVIASAADASRPFSNGPATAQALHAHGLAEHPLVGYREPPAASVALALGRPLYAPSRRTHATHPDYSPRQRDLTPAELRCALHHYARGQGRDIVLVASVPVQPWPELHHVVSIDGAIAPQEDFDVFLLPLNAVITHEADAACPEVMP